jgi:pSer/pThr/pTyr-binding forkhead associated (FHA) protein
VSADVRHQKSAVPAQFMLRSLEDGRTFALTGEMLVGREVDCHISLPSRHVSRYQAKVQVTALGVVVEDLHSTNGTYVNGRRISSPRLLSPGDEVSFYATRFLLVEDEVAPSDETAFASLDVRTDVPRTRPHDNVSGRGRPAMSHQDDEATRLFGSPPVRRTDPPKRW